MSIDEKPSRVNCLCENGHNLLQIYYDPVHHDGELMLEGLVQTVETMLELGDVQPLCPHCGSSPAGFMFSRYDGEHLVEQRKLGDVNKEDRVNSGEVPELLRSFEKIRLALKMARHIDLTRSRAINN